MNDSSTDLISSGSSSRGTGTMVSFSELNFAILFRRSVVLSPESCMGWREEVLLLEKQCARWGKVATAMRTRCYQRGKEYGFVASGCSKVGLRIQFVGMTPRNGIVRRCNLVKVRRTVCGQQ